MAFNPPSKYPESQVTTPAGNGIEITPDDDNDLVDFNRELFIGVGGNMRVTMAANGEVVNLIGLLGGARLPYIVSRIHATGTTATNIVAVW